MLLTTCWTKKARTQWAHLTEYSARYPAQTSTRKHPCSSPPACSPLEENVNTTMVGGYNWPK